MPDETKPSTAVKREYPAERTVTLRLAKHPQVDTDKYDKALGYLMTWGLNAGNMPQVRIFGDESGYLEANYLDDKGDYKFTIGAVYRKQSDGAMGYDFNS